VNKYTDWVRTLPCCATGVVGPSDPHHIKGYGWLTGAGVSGKGSDLLCIPLRPDVHRELHDIGWESWEEKYNRSQLEEAVRTLILAERFGIIEINIKAI
jgi:hypothetical protein